MCIAVTCVVGIAVDGDSEVGGIKPIILVKRSGKVVDLEQEVNGIYIYLILMCAFVMISAEIVVVRYL